MSSNSNSMPPESRIADVDVLSTGKGKGNAMPDNLVGIGIDFGTSNTTAALYDGSRVTMVNLETNSSIMPSALYLDREFAAFTGQEAIDTYIARNQGRKVELSAEVLGEARTGTGQIDPESTLPTLANTSLIYGQSFQDAGLPGRLFRGTKRLLGSVDNERIQVFNRPFRLVALITPILLRVRNQIAIALAEAFPDTASADDTASAHACIGHPVNFEGQDLEHNRVALERLSEAAQHAGVINQTFHPEPTAAALSYLSASRQAQGSHLLIVDFGGGTLDLCVLKRQQQAFDVVSIHGVALGGDHIDQTLFRQVLFPLLGKGETWRREVDGKQVTTAFPFDGYEELLVNWTVSYMLNQNQYLTPVIDMIRQGGPAAVKFQRLYELITQNYGYQAFQAIKDCKATLSVEQSARLDIPELDIDVRVTREEFEQMISVHLQQFTHAVEETLAKANLPPAAIALVLRTGGSSLMPAVRNILDREFPDKVVEHDPFTSVAAGLAIADYRRLAEEKSGSP